jgi:hypothetical protein
VSDDSKKTMIGISPFRLDPPEPEADEEASAQEEAPERAPEAPAEPAAASRPREESASRAAASVDEYIAAKRKDLALKTQRLNLEEIDWDVDLSKLPEGPAAPGPAAAAWEADTDESSASPAAEPAADDADAPADASHDDAVAGTGTMLFGADAVQRIREASQRLEQEDPLPPPPVSADAIEPRPPTGRPEVAQTQGLTVTEPAAAEPEASSAITDHGMPAAPEPETPPETAASGTMMLAAQRGDALEDARTEIPAAVRPAPAPAQVQAAESPADAPLNDAPLNDAPKTLPTARPSPREASTTPVVIATGLFILILVAIGVWWLTT